MKIALLHEHPEWSQRLIRRFRDDDIQTQAIDIAELSFDTAALSPDYPLLVNRVNVMPSAGRPAAVAFHTVHFLRWLELAGVRVINGAQAHMTGASKVVQNGIFASLGLDFPAALAICRTEDAPAAAQRIGYPVIVKPNIGGSGAGIARYDDEAQLRRDVAAGALDLGIDGTGLVQAYIESDGFIQRVEVLGDELFYAIRQRVRAGEFNYCAADGCHSSGDALPDPAQAAAGEFDFCVATADGASASAAIEPFLPDAAIIARVVAILRTAGADLGGVEYLIDQRSGRPCFYDFNPYSNFVTDGETLLGFSPEQRFVDFIRGLYPVGAG